MTTIHLEFVATPGEAGPPRDGTAYVVLDTTWTPGPGDPGDAIPLRVLAGEVLRGADLFEEALSRLDAWSTAARMVDELTLDGVTYWYRLRESAWHWLHERLIWERAIAAAAGTTAPTALGVPDHEQALLEVALALGRARGIDVVARGPGAEAAAATPAPATPAPAASAAAAHAPERVSGAPAAARLDLGRLAGRLQRLVGRASRGPSRPDALRADLLAERLRILAADPPGPIVVLTNTRLHQRIGDAAARRVEDPNLGPVIARLRDVGLDPVVIGLGLDHEVDADWPVIASDPRLLPHSVLRQWRRKEDVDGTLDEAIRQRVRAAASVPLDVHGVDLAPALTTWLAQQAASIVGVILRQVPRIERFVDALGPRAVVLTHEGIQTAWLRAARDRRIPTFAVQHGMLYATHPGYRHPRDPRLPLPNATFVTGPFERDVLLRHGGYEPDEVVVAGSPRLEADGWPGAGAGSLDEREEVRRELGVTGAARMLVVSTGFLPLHRRFTLAASLGRLFERPVPGVHIVFKLHPGERDEGPYRELLLGLARAGSFSPPPISIVRDVDLHRLLRAADAHLGLHSTVLLDAVALGTPNLIAVDQAHADLLGYVAAGVARPVGDANELAAALDDLRPPDEAARRTFLAAHFEPGRASERIVSHIMGTLEASR